jgi:hypothetical protein
MPAILPAFSCIIRPGDQSCWVRDWESNLPPTDRRRFPLLFRFSFCAFQSRGLSISLQFMHTKLLAFSLAIGLAGTCMVNAQSPSPTASPSPAKHRSHKKADTTKAAAPAATSNASPAEATAASPSPAEKRTRKTKKTAAAATSPSPAAATAASPSPAAKHARKGKTTAAVSATVTPSPSPAKKTLADFFKPKSSVSPSPSPAAATTIGSTKTKAAPNVGATPAPGGGHGLVWVNTETHIYHKEGSRFYGKTKKGKYVSEADAIKEGDRAAK